MSFVRSKFFVVTGAAVLFLLLTFLGKELYKKYQIRQDIKSLQEEALQVEGQNQELLDLINYLKTPEYKERQARSVLNLQKPGEIAVALPQPAGAGPEAGRKQTGESGVKEPNFKKWWDYFFSGSR